MGNPLEPGTRLGPYEIRSTLGFGGMGEVYRAHDPRLKRDIAIKVLAADVAMDDSFRIRLQHEARAVAGLNHPNVVAVFDVGDNYIVSELVDGVTLRSAGRLTARQCMDLAVQIADGLAAAHSIGIIHRDIKPENIMVTRDGRAKILDFGLAKPVVKPMGGSGNTVALTETGMIMGTVGYMSPEQLRGAPLDHRSDIFSFGVLLHEMLSGQRVFPGSSAAEIMSATLMSDPEPLPATVPPGIAGVVMNCLDKDPTRRFQSTRDLSASLRAMSLGTQAITTPEPAPVLPAPRWRFASAAVAIGIVLSLAAGLGAGSYIFRPEWPTYSQQTSQRGFVSSGRFTSARGAIVFSSLWSTDPSDVFLTEVTSPEARALNLPGAHLFSISGRDELAVGLNCRYVGDNSQLATLAVVPLNGGAPRTLLPDVSSADWDPGGRQLAIVRVVGGASRLEYPPGKVLVQASGWIGDVRFSPRGDQIAFSDHPMQNDDRGSIAVVDLQGARKQLTREWESLEGLAWSKDGREIWFSAADSGWADTVYAVTAEGKQRMLARFPIGVKVEDLTPDGTLLFTRFDDNRAETFMHLPQAAADKCLNWLGSTVPADLTPDGKMMLFSHFVEAGGSNHTAYERKLDAPSPVRLGAGRALSLSPDGKRALVLVSGPSPSLAVYEYETPNPQPLPGAGLTYAGRAAWFPNSARILFAAQEKNRGMRLWTQDVPAGLPKPVTPEGVYMQGQALSPDASAVAGKSADGALRIFPLDGSAPREVPGIAAHEQLVRWTSAQKLVVRSTGTIPVHLYEIDLTSGKRTFWKDLNPANPVGVSEVTEVLISADGETILYGQNRKIRSLHLAYGLH